MVWLINWFSVWNWSDVEVEQIDFIDSCVEEEEEGRSQSGRGNRDSTSLSSQFMAYIERRITREVSATSCCGRSSQWANIIWKYESLMWIAVNT